MGKYPPAYLADGTYAFTFSTHTFAGIGAQLPVFAVGALAAIHSVVTADTLTARDPLRARREKAPLTNMFAHSRSLRNTTSIILVRRCFDRTSNEPYTR